MLQLYFFTVISTVLSGLVLAGEFLSERSERFSEYAGFQNKAFYQIVLACFTFLIALINLFSTVPGDIPVLGNLFPTLMGFIAAVLIISTRWNAHVAQREAEPEKEIQGVSGLSQKIESVSRRYHAAVGLITVVVGLLHAVFPRFALL